MPMSTSVEARERGKLVPPHGEVGAPNGGDAARARAVARFVGTEHAARTRRNPSRRRSRGRRRGQQRSRKPAGLAREARSEASERRRIETLRPGDLGLEKLGENEAERVEIAEPRVARALERLRSEIAPRAAAGCDFAPLGRKAEVDERRAHGLAGGVRFDDDVFRLHVTVSRSRGVEVAERVTDVARDDESELLGRALGALGARLERSPRSPNRAR